VGKEERALHSNISTSHFRVVSEELDEGDEKCGAVVSLRSKVDRIQLWTRRRKTSRRSTASGANSSNSSICPKSRDRARFPGKFRQYTTWLSVVVVVFFQSCYIPGLPALGRVAGCVSTGGGWRSRLWGRCILAMSRCTAFTSSVYASVSRLSKSYNSSLPFLYPLSMYAM
jgi:hypothetical protein